MTDAERAAALESIADEIRACTRCRLHEGRTRAVPGEGSADTEVVFVGEGPGFNEDREGRPFVGRAGALLTRLLASIGWQRNDVFITNVVKCRPPENRDPEPDEIAACAPFLTRQLAVLDPALVVTLGRHSMGRFMPGARISSAHGTSRPVDPALGPTSGLVFAMYHPAAALRTPAIESQSYDDIASVPLTLEAARRRRESGMPSSAETGVQIPADVAETPAALQPMSPAAQEVVVGATTAASALAPVPEPAAAPAADQLTLF